MDFFFLLLLKCIACGRVSVTANLASLTVIQEECGRRKEENTKVQSQRGCVLNRLEKEVVLFLVFISFHDARLPLCQKPASNMAGNGAA